MVTDDYKNEAISLLALSLVAGVGFYTLKKLAKNDISFYKILKSESYDDFKLNVKQYGSLNIKLKERDSWQEFRKKIWVNGRQLYQDLEAKDIKIVFNNSKDFPPSLFNVADPPKWLFVQGNLKILNTKSIAIVGTRNPSEDGLFITKYVCLLIKEFGAATVSGLATGIDQAVHKHSIKLNIPTIAVLGTGILSKYPSGSDKLRKDILDGGGAIITEYLPMEKYSAKNFVKRNRLQAGLANIVIPVEWKIKSGTAHTFNYAKSYNKHIICFRVPTWNHREELEYAKKNGASIFTIPGEEKKLLDAVYILQHFSRQDDTYKQLPII